MKPVLRAGKRLIGLALRWLVKGSCNDVLWPIGRNKIKKQQKHIQKQVRTLCWTIYLQVFETSWLYVTQCPILVSVEHYNIESDDSEEEDVVILTANKSSGFQNRYDIYGFYCTGSSLMSSLLNVF